MAVGSYPQVSTQRAIYQRQTTYAFMTEKSEETSNSHASCLFPEVLLGTMKHFSRRSETGIGPEALVELWRAKSQDSGWLRQSDWHCSATRAVAVTLSEGRDPGSAVRLLASRRAAQGVGIAESLSDFQALFEVFPHPDSRGLIVVFADSWVESTDLFSHRLTCSDPGSGLSNRQHFERRVHELRESPATREIPYVLALYRHLRIDHDERTSFMMAADMGRACKDSIPEAVATYRGNRMALLVERELLPSRRFDALGSDLERVLESHGVPGQSLHLDIEPVPVDARALQRLLGSLWN